MKRSNLIRLASTAAIAAGMAFAQAPAKPAPPVGSEAPSAHARANRRAQFRERWMSELNLTPAQRHQADAIFGEARQSAKPIRQELMQNREALRQAIRSDDTAKIRSLSTKQATLLGQMVEIRSNAMARFYTKLTPAQKTKAEQLHEQMRQRMEQRKSERTTG